MHLRVKTRDGRTFPNFTPAEQERVLGELALFNARQTFVVVGLCGNCHGLAFLPGVGASALALLHNEQPEAVAESTALTPELIAHFAERFDMLIEVPPTARAQIAELKAEARAPYGVN